jgi:hypothetical protein
MFWLGFIAGLFVGGVIGVFLLLFLQGASDHRRK